MPRRQKKYHYIYKTTCKVNGKYYIGMHSTDNLDDGYIGSGKYLWNAIMKHGKENFEVEFLEFFDDRKQLKKREHELVNEDLIQDSMCMNIQIGGGGGFIDDNHARKAQDAGNAKCLWLRENDPVWVAKKSKNMSISNKQSYAKGRQINLPNWTGKKHTEHTKELMRNVDRTGYKNSQFGKVWVYHLEKAESKRIHLEELQLHIKDGWIKGRKIKF